MRIALPRLVRFAVCASILPIMACTRSAPPPRPVDRATGLRAEVLPAPYSLLTAMALPKAAPAPGDWLGMHEEHGQSLAEFRAAPPRRPTGTRADLVLARLGTPGAEQRRVLALTAIYLETFYGIPTRFGPDLELASIPSRARRATRGFGLQVQSRYVLDSMLVASRPPDAFAYVALSTLDLYPEQDWNFVFGQALPSEGVGVWSMARFDDPRDPSGKDLLLTRTLHTAAHEMGHLLGLPHCIAYECLMNGSNSLPESDARPLELCPVCMAKVCGLLSLDPAARARDVSRVLNDFDLAAEAAREGKIQRVLEEKSTPRSGQ